MLPSSKKGEGGMGRLTHLSLWLPGTGLVSCLIWAPGRKETYQATGLRKKITRERRTANRTEMAGVWLCGV